MFWGKKLTMRGMDLFIRPSQIGKWANKALECNLQLISAGRNDFEAYLKVRGSDPEFEIFHSAWSDYLKSQRDKKQNRDTDKDTFTQIEVVFPVSEEDYIDGLLAREKYDRNAVDPCWQKTRNGFHNVAYTITVYGEFEHIHNWVDTMRELSYHKCYGDQGYFIF